MVPCPTPVQAKTACGLCGSLCTILQARADTHDTHVVRYVVSRVISAFKALQSLRHRLRQSDLLGQRLCPHADTLLGPFWSAQPETPHVFSLKQSPPVL